MQFFGALFSENKPEGVALVLVTAIVTIAVLIFLYRLLFGRRLHMAGNSRARQPRLGVVDAFDLDRQRQLVLVRRDNVEHLIMIGGPNDLVIESAFVRMQPGLGMPLGREKDPNMGATAPMVPIAVPIVAAPPSSPAIDPPGSAAVPGPALAPTVAVDRDRAVPPLDLGEPIAADTPPAAARVPVTNGASDPLASIPAPAPVPLPIPPQPVAEPEPAQPTAAAEPDAAPPPPPPRPVAAQSRFAAAYPPRPLATPGASGMPPRPSLAPRPPIQASALPQRTPTLGPRPMPTSPLSRGTSAASLRRDPPGAAPPVTPTGPVAVPEPAPPKAEKIPENDEKGPEAAAAPPVAPVPEAVDTPSALAEPPSYAPPAAPEKPEPALPTTLDTLESLEEEMARLLGRPPGAADRS